MSGPAIQPFTKIIDSVRAETQATSADFVRSDGALDWAAASRAVRVACRYRGYEEQPLLETIFNEIVREESASIYQRLSETLSKTEIDASHFEYDGHDVIGFADSVRTFALSFCEMLTPPELRLLEAYRPHPNWRDILLLLEERPTGHSFTVTTIIGMMELALGEIDDIAVAG